MLSCLLFFDIYFLDCMLMNDIFIKTNATDITVVYPNWCNVMTVYSGSVPLLHHPSLICHPQRAKSKFQNSCSFLPQYIATLAYHQNYRSPKGGSIMMVYYI
jgi:hypothetical protein